LTQNYTLAEDLTQETMLRAVKHRITVAKMDDPRCWLFQIVTNLWRDRLRARKRRPARDNLHTELVDDSCGPQTTVEIGEHLENVLASFQELPETQRQVLFLKTVEEHSIDEISQILSLSRNNVKANLSHARKKMRQKFLEPSTDDKK